MAFGLAFGLPYVISAYNGGANPHPNSDLLLEDNSFFLLEDGISTLLLEA